MSRTITLIYFIFGATWVFITDRLLTRLDIPVADRLQWQTLKGWIYVLISTALLYLLLRRQQRRDAASMAALMQSQEEVQRMNSDLEQHARRLELANREAESFAYAVSHDLRAPLRGMFGFSQILLDSAADGLDEQTLHYLRRIHDAGQRMSCLIDDLLNLSRISRSALERRPVDLTGLAADVAASMQERYPDRPVQVRIAGDMHVHGDLRLLRIAIDNLLNNAWKYTGRESHPEIEVGVQRTSAGAVYFVRDNGVGFDMNYAEMLFSPFQRLHAEAEFPGNGIGLATVQRILSLHGGRIWAEAQPGRGATFYFTLEP
ncbi:histidine kinase [Steroidobacter denitrificans]|uniref:histidine kinase n=1 Tax=Steroidobacter denitrificans TaxID=465721 RepID=A0A127F8A9_STEDE|nr:ATP-binding protein [Steroidobacter denitrificans]AMN46654.1 histidine kinase [Steroidobacter denitrificans]